MKDDAISRQATIMALVFSEDTGGMTCGQMAKVLDVIKAVPSAQPERKRGKWIMDMDRHSFLCSMCGAWQKYNRNYCPNCGADMREDDHDHT